MKERVKRVDGQEVKRGRPRKEDKEYYEVVGPEDLQPGELVLWAEQDATIVKCEPKGQGRTEITLSYLGGKNEKILVTSQANMLRLKTSRK